MQQQKFGLILAVCAYGLWGVFPLYVYQLKTVEPISVLAFRAVATLCTILPIAIFLGRRKVIIKKLSSLRSIASLLLSSTLICINWGIFVYVVFINQTLQSSLAYYINPLVNVAIGGIFLGERFRKLQLVSIAIATAAVSVFAYEVGTVPYWSLALAGTFAAYGFVRKFNPTDSLSALTIETFFMTPVAFTYLYYCGSIFEFGSYTHSVQFWIIMSGLITGIPLLLFGGAAKRLKFSTLGLIQYISPTGQFLCAVLALNEKMLTAQWVCFGLIWVALFIFSFDTFMANRE